MKTKNTLSLPKTRRPHGFTLVELIVVITILVILGTIAFVSLSGFSGSARDSSRVSDLTNLSKGLDIAYVRLGSYPTPDSAFQVTYSGWVLWNQGTAGDSTMNVISAGGAKMSRKPTDPLNITKEYTYSTLAYGNAYQLKADYEGDSVASRGATKGLVDEAFAATGNPLITYLKGTYNGIAAKTQTGNIIYLVATPSIITSQSGAIGSGFEITTVLANKLLVHGSTNSGGIAYTAKLVFSSSSLPSNDSERILFASGIANAYSGTTLATQSNIQTYITALASGNTGSLASLGGSFVSSSLGGSASVTTPTPTVTATTFSLSSSSVTIGASVTLSDTCASHPTSYTSSNTAVATVSSTTITTLTAGTTTITPVGGNCTDSTGKALTVTTPVYSPGQPYASALTYTATQTFTYNGATITVTSAGVGTSNSPYLNCPSNDIAIWTNGATIPQVWSLCNVGATTVFAGFQASADDSPVATVATAWKYFQWGEDTAWNYNGGVTSTDNCTWDRVTQACGASALGSWSTTVSDVTSGGVARWNDWSTTDNQGPCASGYHIPTQPEWGTAYTTLGSARNTFVNTMKLPMAGFRDNSGGSLNSQGSYGLYWSSSPTTTRGDDLYFDNTTVYPTVNNIRSFGFSVRCLKN